MRVSAVLAVVFSLGLWGQTMPPPAPAKLVYNGKPVRVPFACTAEHFTEFDLACTPEAPCPVFVELANVAGVATKLFISGNFHTASATLSSLLLVSEDEGHTWSEAWKREPGVGLEQIQFFDFSNGWISGGVFSTPPRDPFLLVTTDGGVTWRRRPVYGESRPGTVDQFLFDSAKQGNLLIDRVRASEEGHRYELYQSVTGGESWTIQQISRQPLRLPRTRDERSGWRVRAEAASKSFVVEQTEGQKWRTVASFLIDSGQCQPPE